MNLAAGGRLCRIREAAVCLLRANRLVGRRLRGNRRGHRGLHQRDLDWPNSTGKSSIGVVIEFFPRDAIDAAAIFGIQLNGHIMQLQHHLLIFLHLQLLRRPNLVEYVTAHLVRIDKLVSLFLDALRESLRKILAADTILDLSDTEEHAQRYHQQRSGHQYQCSQTLDRDAHLSLSFRAVQPAAAPGSLPIHSTAAARLRPIPPPPPSSTRSVVECSLPRDAPLSRPIQYPRRETPHRFRSRSAHARPARTHHRQTAARIP